MRFVCDSTVGKLARFLRMAGFDTAYVKKDDLSAVLSISKEENRMILSRNSQFGELRLADQFFHLAADDPFEQFRSVVTAFGLQLEAGNFLTRCLECNELLEKADKEKFRDRLWKFVADTQPRIFYCPRCDKLYWPATHARSMISRLLAIKSELDQSSEHEHG